MDGHPPKRCGGTPESSRLPPPQLGGRRATHFSFRNQPRRSTAVFCQANQKRFSFQVRLTALPKEARGTSPFDGDGHEALESVARHRVRRGTPPPHSALRLALDGDVQRGRLGPRVPRLPMDRDLRQRGLQLPRVDRVGGDVRAFLLLEIRSDGRVIFTRDNRFATYFLWRGLAAIRGDASGARDPRGSPRAARTHVLRATPKIPVALVWPVQRRGARRPHDRRPGLRPLGSRRTDFRRGTRERMSLQTRVDLSFRPGLGVVAPQRTTKIYYATPFAKAM